MPHPLKLQQEHDGNIRGEAVPEAGPAESSLEEQAGTNITPL